MTGSVDLKCHPACLDSELFIIHAVMIAQRARAWRDASFSL